MKDQIKIPSDIGEDDDDLDDGNLDENAEFSKFNDNNEEDDMAEEEVFK